jgi:hypothetical protein
MRSPSACVPLLALTSLCSHALAQETLVVNIGGNSSGDFCGSPGCTPSSVATSPAFPLMQVVTQLGGFQPVFVLLALPPHQCTPLPGFAGSLMLSPPGVALLVTPQWGHFPHAPCASWMGFASIQLPAPLPSGFQFLVQVLAPPPPTMLDWTFSNAVQVTIL